MAALKTKNRILQYIYITCVSYQLCFKFAIMFKRQSV